MDTSIFTKGAGWWVTVISILVVTVYLISWDLVVATNKVQGDTISEIIAAIARKHLIIPTAFGIVAGHFFWPGTPRLVPSQTIGAFVIIGLLVIGFDLLHWKYDLVFWGWLEKYPIVIFQVSVILGHLTWSQP